MQQKHEPHHEHCKHHAASPAEPDARYDQLPADYDGPVYTCPMHPQVRQRAAGSCPICGMALEPESGATDADTAELDDMRERFRVSLLLTVPLFVIAMGEMIPAMPLLHDMPPTLGQWLQFALAAPVVLWGGWPFFVRGWQSLKSRHLNMFTLIGLGVGVAFFYSLVALLAPGLFPDGFRGHNGEVAVYFEAAAVITTLVLLGQVLELRARSQTSSAIRALLELAPPTAERLDADGNAEDVAVDHVQQGDLLRVRPGAKVPLDGEITKGKSAVDESMVTGEPVQNTKVEGDAVIGGTVNGTGTFIMRVTKTGDNTVLAQIVRMVSEAQRSRAPVQQLVDVIAAWFVPAVVLVAIVTFIVWAIFGPAPALAFAIVNAVAVLIIACPCALGLATPMSIMVATGKGAQHGILVRNAEVLEALERIDTVVVDKTGTLTEGHPAVVSLQTADGFDSDELLALVAAVESSSEHPLGAAIVAAAKARGLEIDSASGFESVTGQGVKAKVAERQIAIGNQKLLRDLDIDDAAFSERADELRQNGETVVFVAIDGRLAGILGVADPIRSTSKEAIKKLHDAGIEVVMLTGDNETTARSVAAAVGIDTVHADVSPEDKHHFVNELQGKGRRVAMAGDGINDAPALAQADVGIAMGTGTDVAMESAGVTLVHGDLLGVARALTLGHATMRNIRQNLVFAFAYNAAGVPIAAGILYPFFGLLLNPMIGAAAMSLSSLSVIGNALRLRALKL